MMRVIISVIFLLIFVSGCGTEKPSNIVQCGTFEGIATWTGKCENGLAQGFGTASFDDHHISSFEGNFVAGSPEGQVKIAYDMGGSYVGGYKDGDEHGFGTDMEAWGEGYEGDWHEGYKHGDGIYITNHGERISGKWDMGRFLGSWYKDRSSGCEVWWAAESEPTGVLTWDGECRNGKAHGQGSVYWTADDLGAPLQSEVKFSGYLEYGKLVGAGEWIQTRVYSNAIHTIKKTGTWSDSQLEGAGTFREDSNFTTDAGFKIAWVTYEGQFKRGIFSGKGRREKYKESRDGHRESWIEEGEFSRNKFNGVGKMRVEAQSPGKWHRIELSEGIHKDREFRGPGERTYEYITKDGKHTSKAEYNADISEGGTGVVIYSDGDQFEGKVDARGEPVDGVCNLSTMSFVGACVTTHRKTSDWSGEECLSPKNSPNVCLKMIRSWVF